jgi:hypothetical protein
MIEVSNVKIGENIYSVCEHTIYPHKVDDIKYMSLPLVWIKSGEEELLYEDGNLFYTKEDAENHLIWEEEMKIREYELLIAERRHNISKIKRLNKD